MVFLWFSCSSHHQPVMMLVDLVPGASRASTTGLRLCRDVVKQSCARLSLQIEMGHVVWGLGGYRGFMEFYKF